MPTSPQRRSLAAKIAALPEPHTNKNPLWKGPCGAGPLGGITQSMIVRFLSCRERFRLKYVLGLEPPDKWNHRLGYGHMWHVCEEALAKDGGRVEFALSKLAEYTGQLNRKYPLQHDEITKWYHVCYVQFPEYVRYWSEHPDVKNRVPLLQEHAFDVSYTLPSGRVVRLRGKDDSVDLITDEVTGLGGGVYLQENKTKGDVDKLQIERQLKFDLQTMLYLIALREKPSCDLPRTGHYRHSNGKEYPILGVRYNVVRRPLSGGRGNIKPHAARYTKTKTTPAESMEAFYERLRRDYIAAEPDYWFFRVRAEISARDIQVSRDTCLDPLLETLCWWYDFHVKGVTHDLSKCGYLMESLNYRTPFGVYSALEEGGATEYDHYLETGSEATLRRVHTLFPELQ
jgi:hypothetical protein